MYLNKYDIKGETYVKLDELNDLIETERKAIARKMKKRHADGEDNTGWAGAHSQLTDLARKINMSECGEKYIIFCRDDTGEWEYFMQLVKWDDIPEFVRRHMSKKDDEYAVVGTSEIDEATLFDCIEDAQDALAEIEAECKEQAGKWHMIKRWMFDTEDNRDSILRLFYDGNNDYKKHCEKAKAIEQAENAIKRTRAALDKTEKLLTDIKDDGEEKPSETPQKPSKRKLHYPGCPGRYAVWYRTDEDTTQHCMGFVRFEKGIPVFTNRPCKATWFVWRGMAEKVAEKCGDGFEVVDMIDSMTAEERLLRAIFHEDGMDGEDDDVCEWCGDGVKAEDEDWNDDDSKGELH